MPDLRSQPEAVSPVPLDERGFIAADLPCVGCSYDLRGLEPTGNCPECNAPVALALRSDALCFAPVEWLKHIRSGLLLLIIATAGVPAHLFASFRLFPYDEHTQACVITGGLVILSGVAAIGSFRATARIAAGSATPIAESPTRRLARVATATNVAAALLLGAGELTGLGARWPSHDLVWGCLLLLTATFGVVSVSLLLHLTTLLRRTRSIGLARAVACSAFGLGVSTGLMSCGGILAVFFGASDSNIPGACAFLLGGLTGAMSFVAVLVVLILSRRALAAELRIAAAMQPAHA